jgi:DNA ligase-1
MSGFKPMLAGKLDPAKLKFPVIIQPKLDGIRATVVGGKLLTRTLKEVPNRFIFDMLSKPEFEGLDGELIQGSPTAEDCYRQTVSAVMSSDGEPDFTYYVFDVWNCPDGYEDRAMLLEQRIGYGHPHIKIVNGIYASTPEELDRIEADYINAGHEGGIVRGPQSLYKQGRGTATKGDLLKLKRFVDGEAEVIDVIEELHNANEATTNALGRTERSSHKENKHGKGTMGALVVRDVVTGVEFKIGTGFDAADRTILWNQWNRDPDLLKERLVRYKSFPVGVKDKPRHPVFLGWRDRRDFDG